MKIVYGFIIETDVATGKKLTSKGLKGQLDLKKKEIFINNALNPLDKTVTIIHELIHYFTFRFFSDTSIGFFIDDFIDYPKQVSLV